jgi:hypothetical protein
MIFTREGELGSHLYLQLIYYQVMNLMGNPLYHGLSWKGRFMVLTLGHLVTETCSSIRFCRIPTIA